MDYELVPEFVYDQGAYYPATGNYYGYVSTGVEPPNELDDHHRYLGVNDQNLQFSGLQSENFPCVYYTPCNDYSQSPYNPFNPYIPGAVIGTDGSYMGTQQSLTMSPYIQTVSPPGYLPIIESGSDAILSGSPDALHISDGAMEYTPPLSTMCVTTAPLKASFENLSLEPSHSSSHQIPVSGRFLEGAGVIAAPRKFSSYGAMTTGGAPQINQVMEHSSFGGFASVRSPLKATLPPNSDFTNPGSNLHGWSPVDRMRPRIQYNGVPNRSFGDQNMGPRIKKTRSQLTSPLTLRAYTTGAGTVNFEGNIIIHADQYNRDDFSDDYPDAKFFVIKSYSEDDVHKSIKYNVWSSTSSGNKKLDIAYKEAQRLSVEKSRKCPVFLFFSVNASGHFCGVAEMVGPVDFHKDMDFWLQDKWTGCFPVKWHIIKDVPNSSLRYIVLVNNESRPVTSSRDTQEVQRPAGLSMLSIFKKCLVNTCILDDFMLYEEHERIMQEEKSKLLAIKSYELCVSPRACVPSIKPHESINGPPSANEQQQKNSVIQPPSTNEKETKAKADHFLQSEERKALPSIVDQDLKAEDKLKDDSNPSLESDGAKQLEAKSDRGRNRTTPKRTCRLSPNGVHSRGASKDAQNQGKTGENDVFTVGSVEIEITDSNRYVSGTLTIGSNRAI